MFIISLMGIDTFFVLSLVAVLVTLQLIPTTGKIWLFFLTMFIDSIRVSQVHFGKHRVFSDGLVAHLDSDGNIERTTLKSVRHEGSDSTFIQIRCDGKQVNVSGNVGRFNRPDNVFNYDLECTMTIINNILESLDIPPFTSGEVFHRESRNKYGENIYTPETTGARFSEIHCTQNYSTGSPQNATDFLYNAGMVKPGRQNTRAYLTGATYGEGSRYKASKMYNKAEDLKRLVKSGKLENSQYVKDLIQWCEEQGMVRAEVQYRDFLQRNSAAFWGHLSHIQLDEYYKDDENIMIKETEILDINKLTTTLKATYYDYIHGVNLKDRLSNGKYYRHKNALSKFGIDIGITLNVERLPVQTKIIKVQPCVSIPDFYYMPDVQPWSEQSHLSLVKSA